MGLSAVDNKSVDNKSGQKLWLLSVYYWESTKYCENKDWFIFLWHKAQKMVKSFQQDWY